MNTEHSERVRVTPLPSSPYVGPNGEFYPMGGGVAPKSYPRLSRYQEVLSRLCKKLAGDEHEERATNLLPESYRIKGVRLWLYRRASRFRFIEGNRLFAKHGTHVFQ